MIQFLVEEVVPRKHLAVAISKDLNWKEHIENVATSASRCLDVLNALKFKMDRSTLEHLSVAFIRSKWEYASIVWDGYTCTQELSDLVVFQKLCFSEQTVFHLFFVVVFSRFFLLPTFGYA